MKKIFLSFVATVLFVGLSAAKADVINTLSNEQKLSDLDQLVALVKSGYGPLRYKKEKLNIDVDALRATYAAKVLDTKSNAEYYYQLMQFISEFHDGHFRATLPTTRVSELPISTDLVDGHVLIDSINRDLLPEDEFKFQKGDEILAVDGQPISAVLDDLQKYRGLGFSQSERRMAAMAVSIRTAARMPAPEGTVKLHIRRGLSNVEADAELKWKVKGDAIDEVLKSTGVHNVNFKKALNGLTANGSYFDDLSTFDLMKEFENSNVERSFRCSGDSRIEQPEKATVIMKTPFVAYYYPTAFGNVGYLRIPHYSPEDKDYDKRFAQYEFAVAELEKNTVGLVIDQDHNCGGSVSYLHRILSLFADKPVAPMQFQLLANKEEYTKCQGWLKEAADYTIEKSQLEKVCGLIKTSWLKGDFMTEKTAIDGQDLVYPNQVRYTKPIVMLIDEMSGSGGDAFPSLMKGYGRAKLIGTRTMGLGGHVVAQAALFYSQIVPEMTKSLFYRPDGVAVENNGAEPDFAYSITRDDFVYGYHGYRAFYEQKLADLVNATKHTIEIPQSLARVQ